MKIHILQHVPFENAGFILDWAQAGNFPVSFTRFFRREEVPQQLDFDLLIIMGGPMNLNETIAYPWLVQEKAFLKNCLAAGKKMVGICLGSQILAEMLGSKVFPNKYKEIGWFPVRKDRNAHHALLSLFPDETIPAFHWHGDTFSLPMQAIPLFSSQATENQAFVWNNQVFGLQFHWEVKAENVRLLLQYAAGDLTGGPFVQTPEEILANDRLFDTARKNLFRFLDFVASIPF